MDLYEQCVHYIRCTQELDFFQKFENKQLQYIPFLLKEEKNNYFNHPYDKYIHASVINSFIQRFIEVNFDVTRHYLYKLNMKNMDFEHQVYANIKILIEDLKKKFVKNETSPQELSLDYTRLFDIKKLILFNDALYKELHEKIEDTLNSPVETETNREIINTVKRYVDMKPELKIPIINKLLINDILIKNVNKILIILNNTIKETQTLPLKFSVKFSKMLKDVLKNVDKLLSDDQINLIAESLYDNYKLILSEMKDVKTNEEEVNETNEEVNETLDENILSDKIDAEMPHLRTVVEDLIKKFTDK